MLGLIDRTTFFMLAVLCLTLGLAPFTPEPHFWEKLKMLTEGRLSRPIDIFDLLFHAIPWLMLGLKIGRVMWLTSQRNKQA